MNNPVPNLPYRFQEKAFRTYEADLAKAVAAFPLAYRVVPKDRGLSQVTYACRFRDAKKSLKQNRWTTSVNMEKFLDVYDDLIVVERDGYVLIGSKESTRPIFVPPTDSYTEATASAFRILAHNMGEKEILVKLAHERLLTQPILVQGFSLDEVAYFEQNYDIALEEQDSGDHLLR